jgi:hypothetical protein
MGEFPTESFNDLLLLPENVSDPGPGSCWAGRLYLRDYSADKNWLIRQQHWYCSALWIMNCDGPLGCKSGKIADTPRMFRDCQ